MMEELDVEKYPWSKYNIDFGFGSNWDTKDCGKAESPWKPHCLGTWAEWNTWKDRALRPHRTTQTSIWKAGLGETPFWVDLKWD